MIAPLYKLGVFGNAGFIASALLVGLIFGFFLQAGGLADARKLTGQFYLDDFTVLKAMFTAILVAMVGLYWLALVGVLDLDKVYLNPTRLWPMATGGALVGLGFAIGGYCPGTSLVAAVAGKLDGLAFIGGLLAGIAGFALSYGALAGFAKAGDMGPGMTLDRWLGIDPAILVFLIVLMGLAIFWGGTRLEARFTGQKK